MTPPVISAALLYREPNIFPILTPAKENKKVVIPMTVTDFHKSTDKKAKETPTAKASMLVAIAIISIVLKPVLLHEHSAVGC